MSDLTTETQIQLDDIIYNPTENVKYIVIDYCYDVAFKTKVAYLQPFFPFGTSKKNFSITIESMIKLDYKLDKKTTKF